MHPNLRQLTTPIVDGENNPLIYDVAYSISTGSVVETIKAIRYRHAQQCYLLPISAASGGGGIFQIKRPQDGLVIGLRFNATTLPRVRLATDVEITEIALDEIVIDVDHHHIYAGSGITLDQLNQTLGVELSAQYKVLGADLTSYSYAQVGATFMTGGMGPQRRYFSSSVDQISLCNGQRQLKIDPPTLQAYAGTYGWSGLVTAVRCKFYAVPDNEIAFAIPVSNLPRDLARLIAHFSDFTQLDLSKPQVTTATGGSSMIFGLEHITTAAMQPMFNCFGDNPVARNAKQLLDKCNAAAVDGLVFVNGFSNLSVDEFLFELVDDAAAEDLTIADIKLEHTQLFPAPEQMRALREAVPFAIRTQSPQGKFIYKGHTDATIKLNPAKVQSAMQALWQANCYYVDTINDYFQSNKQVRGQILVYGHLNPVGVDPHNRITFACDDSNLFATAKIFVRAARDEFYRALNQICESTQSEFVGGEKGAGSEFEMFAAFASDALPVALKTKFKAQSALIRASSPMFNWRAVAPYKSQNLQSRFGKAISTANKQIL